MNEVVVVRDGGRSSSGAVGRALRVLMIRYGVGVDDAFELLVRGARRAHLDLKDVATGIVHAEQRRPGGGPRSCTLRPRLSPAGRRSPAA